MAEKNFIDFILDANDNEPLLRGFTEAGSLQDLKDFFTAQGYTGIDATDAQKIWQAKQDYGLMGWPPPPNY